MSTDVQTVDGERVLIVAPTRRDGEVTVALLRQAFVRSQVCTDVQELARHLSAGAGAVLLSDRALVDPRINALLAVLGRQPEWSDLPVLVSTPQRDQSPPAARVLSRLTNVTLLDRPTSARAMVSAVQAALRARRRQFQIRDQLIDQLEAEHALRDADRRKDEFLATLAHELRNPLAPIRTGLQVLERIPGETPQAARVRGMMGRQVEQLVKLIDDLLDVSRIATGTVALRRQRLDMRAVIDAAVEAAQPLIDAAQLQLSVERPPSPVWVVGDASRLTQVVGNLINNAAKYTPKGGRVSVTLRQHADEAVLQVIDNGDGIPHDMLERIFEMFTQVKRSPERVQDGLGIGLSLVRRLLQLHGGSVIAESAGFDSGSTLTVRLPLAEPVPPVALLPVGDAHEQSLHRSIRVLVVDDNVDAADALALQLEMGGHQTRTVYSGAVALQAAQEFQPEVVFCDIGMADMNGHEVAAHLRADHRHASTVLVAITGWGSEEDKRRTRSTGFDFHLVKPVSAEAVDDILSRL